MYHGMILAVLVEFGLTGSYYYLLLTLVVSFILAYLSYVYVETPAMALAKNRNKARENARKQKSEGEVFAGNKEKPVPVAAES